MEGRSSVLQAGARASLAPRGSTMEGPRGSLSQFAPDDLLQHTGQTEDRELTEEEIKAAELAAKQEQLKSVDVAHVQRQLNGLKEAEEKFRFNRKKAIATHTQKEKQLAELSARLEEAERRYAAAQDEIRNKQHKASQLRSQIAESTQLMKAIAGNVATLNQGLTPRETVAKNILRPKREPVPRQNGTFRPHPRGPGASAGYDRADVISKFQTTSDSTAFKIH